MYIINDDGSRIDFKQFLLIADLDEARRFNQDEARYNLATRIMSNGVEVIVAGDKSTYPGEPMLRRIVSTANRPITLAPSTLSDHMQMLLPQDASEVSKI